jgi:hypothetical protein
MVITSEQSHARWIARQEEIRLAKKKIKNEVQKYSCQQKLSKTLPNSYFMDKMILQNKSRMDLTYISVELRDFMYEKLDIEIKHMKYKLKSLLKQRDFIEEDMYMIGDYSDFKYSTLYGTKFEGITEHDILNNTKKYQHLKSKWRR